MEFIPLEKYSKQNVKKQKIENKIKNVKISKDLNCSTKNLKHKGKISLTEKKNLKNKGRENLVLKKKQTIPKRNFLRIKKKEDEEEDDVENEEENCDDNNGEENEIDDNEVQEKKDMENFLKKCKELDEKKKNRLFVKLKKKIYSEGQIKALHPDIKSVIFPRKKNSRWCWAVFASEEKANRAMISLKNQEDVFVNKPNPYEKVLMKRKKRIKRVLQKKESRMKLQKMWM